MQDIPRAGRDRKSILHPLRPGATCSTLRSAGLVAIDHISQSMHYEEMLSWLLFYKSLLDLSKLPEQDVLDPGGLVKGQVLQSEDGALRLILNASQSARTQSSRFLTESFGSGVQHIAFTSRDILATARTLVANGVDLLPIPELAVLVALSNASKRVRIRSIGSLGLS